MNRDDALEWFGGTADIKYAVASNAADDSFDWTFGWSGRAQFVAITQRGDDADNGIEADNNEFNNNLLPRSNPQIYNITLCGDPDTATKAPKARAAANLRRGTAFTLRNFLMTGFKSVGFQISDTATSAQVDNGTSQMGAGVSWGMPTNMHASVTTYITSGRFPNIRTTATMPRSASRRPAAQPRESELPAERRRHAGRGPDRADSAAQRWLLRSGDLHRRRAAGAGRQLDDRLDRVPAALMGCPASAGPSVTRRMCL